MAILQTKGQTQTNLVVNCQVASQPRHHLDHQQISHVSYSNPGNYALELAAQPFSSISSASLSAPAQYQKIRSTRVADIQKLVSKEKQNDRQHSVNCLQKKRVKKHSTWEINLWNSCYPCYNWFIDRKVSNTLFYALTSVISSYQISHSRKKNTQGPQKATLNKLCVWSVILEKLFACIWHVLKHRCQKEFAQKKLVSF